MSGLQALRRYVDILAVSSIYETEPVAVEGPRFLNAVVRVESASDAVTLATDLQRIESRLGRNERIGSAARPIDVDLLTLDDRLVSQVFYLVPLAEIAPDVALSGIGQRVADLAATIAPMVQRRNRAWRFEADRQSGVPEIPISIDRVGVMRVKRTVTLRIDGRERELAAEFSLDADLAHDRAGVHMSRFSERLEDAMLEAFSRNYTHVDVTTLLQGIANDVMTSQRARYAIVEMRASFTLERWTPVSGRRGEETYLLLAAAFAGEEGARAWVGVEVEGMTACPCAQMMMREQGKRELLEAGFTGAEADRALDALPAATHNQRGRGRLVLGLPESSGEPIFIEDLVEIVESSMSSETYELLKRPDEFFVVNKAHRNPRFVEDVVRGILARGLDLYRDFPDGAFIEASQINDESIHKHDAVAYAYGTFAELRAELATGQRLRSRTNLTGWLMSGTRSRTSPD